VGKKSIEKMASQGQEDQGFGPDRRMRCRSDFQRCYRQGGKRHGSFLSLHFHPNGEEEARLGITASRKVGKAVVRNLLKRRTREIFRRYRRRDDLPMMDVVVHLKPKAARAERRDFEGELLRLLGFLADKDFETAYRSQGKRRHSRQGASS
jgi:ribonuclease P protein component